MLDRDTLQKILREVETEISVYDLAKKIGVHVDYVLIFINDSIIPEYKHLFHTNAHQIPKWEQDKIEQFFKQQIIDLGFLCQHKIKEIKETLKHKHNTFGHQTFYNNWIMHRGY